MKEEMDNIIVQNRNHIEIGSIEAESFKNQFQQIVTSVSQINQAMNNAFEAYEDQTQAIYNISNNIASLDTAMKSNLSLIDRNDLTSTKIENNLKELKAVVDEMCVIIRGEKIPNTSISHAS